MPNSMHRIRFRDVLSRFGLYYALKFLNRFPSYLGLPLFPAHLLSEVGLQGEEALVVVREGRLAAGEARVQGVERLGRLGSRRPLRTAELSLDRS